MVNKKFDTRWNFMQLSTDEKPNPRYIKVREYNTLYEMDTGDTFIFYEGEWQPFLNQQGTAGKPNKAKAFCNYVRKSTDKKPDPRFFKVEEGYLCYELDTGKIFIYNGSSWEDFMSQEGGGGGGTSDYIKLENKPQINGVTLIGNKTNEDLGINIPDVSNFIDKDVNDLTNYTSTEDMNDLLDEKADQTEVNVICNNGAKNLLPNPKPSMLVGSNTIIFNMDSDGYVTETGTANDTRGWNTAFANANASVTLPAGKYKFRYEQKTASTDGYLGVGIFSVLNGSYIIDRRGVTGTPNGFVDGLSKDLEFTLAEETTIYILYKLGNGAYRFMIRDASITDTTFEAYGMTNSNLTSNVNAIVNKDKNILINGAITQTLNGLTFTVNSDMSITVNGTATADTQFNLNVNGAIPKGTWKLSGCPSGGGDSKYFIQYRRITGNFTLRDVGGGDTTFNNIVTLSDKQAYDWLGIYIFMGQTLNNLTFYPMLQDARITDNTYTAPVDTGWMTFTGDYMNLSIRKKNGFVTVVYASSLKQEIPIGTTKIWEFPQSMGLQPNNNILTLTPAHDLSSEALVMIGGDRNLNVRVTTAMPAGKTLVINSTYPSID